MAYHAEFQTIAVAMNEHNSVCEVIRRRFEAAEKRLTGHIVLLEAG